MLGFGPIGALPIAAAGPIFQSPTNVVLVLEGLVQAKERTAQGVLVSSTSAIWRQLAQQLSNDWSLAFQIPPEKWEEIVAGAFKKAGYDEVTLTPRSGDHGRDVIAVKHGVGSLKILGSVKRFAPGNLVTKEQVHALMGVVSVDLSASKGILTTTSDFAPKLLDDPGLKLAVPHRIELMNGVQLQKWLSDLSE